MAGKESNNGIFREKSINKVTGPGSLNDYIHVSSPSVWIALPAFVIILAVMLTRGIFGKVTVHHEDGSVEEVTPVTHMIN